MQKIGHPLLLILDRWRESIELPPIALYLKDTIQTYFVTSVLFILYSRPTGSHTENAC